MRLPNAPTKFDSSNEAQFRSQVQQLIDQLNQQWQKGQLPSTVQVNAGAGTAGANLQLVGPDGSVWTLQNAGTGVINILYGSTVEQQLIAAGGNPAGSFNINGNFYVAGVQVVGARIAGYGTPTGRSLISNFPGATATLLQTSEMLAQVITDLKTHGLLGA